MTLKITITSRFQSDDQRTLTELLDRHSSVFIGKDKGEHSICVLHKDLVTQEATIDPQKDEIRFEFNV
jgi:hypothetical protein